MWSDNDTELDLLDFSHLVAAVLSIISDKDLHPATIGIYGDWGSGKSSLMRMVRNTIENSDDKSILAVQFNGWLFESYEDAKSALMGTVLDEIADKRELVPKAKDLLIKLIHRVDWLRISLGVGKYYAANAIAGKTGLALAAATDLHSAAISIAERVKDIKVEDVEKLLKEKGADESNLRMAIRDFREDFKDLLKEANIKTLVVFIDDLDRCSPGTVIEIFEAIRLFLFVPNSVFVIAADEDLIRYAVSTKFPGFQERAGIGRDYLEKLIQYPVKVPALGKTETENYIKLLFVNAPGVTPDQFEQVRKVALERALSTYQLQCLDYECISDVIKDVPAGIIDGFALAESLAPILATDLSGNPRQTKRFLNTLKMRIEMGKGRKIDLNPRFLAKLMVLEYFHTEAFKQLANLQATQEGKPRVLEILEQDRELSKFIENESEPQEARRGESSRDGSKKKVVGNGKPELASSDNETFNDSETAILQAFKSDDTLKTWLNLEPILAGTDLRPYFYFSRDNLIFNISTVRRMGPEAQKILADLLAESIVVRRAAIASAGQLSLADVNSIFSSLADRFRKHDDPKIRDSILGLMFELVEKRKEITSQIILFLRGIPETAIPLSAIVKLVASTKGRDEEKAAETLLQTWSTNKLNPSLARAASTSITRKLEGK